MSKIIKKVSAGTMESSDVYVELEPAEGGVQIQLESVVLNQFGESIEATVRSVLEQFNIDSVKVNVVDRGALDCVIRARVETAIVRGKGE